jgi:hypothetical protein
MTIENLDESKRSALESGTATPYVQDEALRVIDAHAAQRAALVERAERAEAEARIAWDDSEETDRANAAERALAEARAECERLQAEKQADCIEYRDGVAAAQRAQRAAESRLADAVTLLGRVIKQCIGVSNARTEADQAVLDALAAAPLNVIQTLAAPSSILGKWTAPFARAELARRGLK